MKEKQHQKTPMEAWLSEYVKERTAYINRGIFKQYLEWLGKSDTEIVREYKEAKDKQQWNKATKNQILQFQAWLTKEKGYAQNTVRTRIQILRAFYNSQCEQIKNLKGKIVKQTIARGEHIFSLEDMKALRDIGTLRGKAMISTAISLGWETSSFLSLEREFVKRLVARAKSQKEDFMLFETIRAKSGEMRLGILTPIALYDLEKFLKATEKKATEKLFKISDRGLNKWLKSMVNKADIKTIGSIKFHLIRKFLMSALSRAGLNEFEIDLVLGKAIEPSKITYLQTLKNDAFEKYKKAYPQHLSLTQDINGSAKYNILTDLVVQHVKAQRELIKYMENNNLLMELPKPIRQNLESVYEFAKILEKKNGKPKKETVEHEEKDL